MKKSQQRIRLASVSAILLASLVGCATVGATQSPDATPSTTADGSAPTMTEVDSVGPRALLAHDGGLTLLDTESGDAVATVDRPGFLRLNDAGDGRHIVISDGDQFLIYDAGILAEAHGDHAHYYEGIPGLTDIAIGAPKAGHVVTHDDHTTLFADGTGIAVTVKSHDIADRDATFMEHDTGNAHHGVAVQLRDGTMLSTAGTSEGRTTVQAFRDHKMIASTDACPGVHGEAVAADEAAVFGCEGGPVIWRDDAFYKVTAADAYARTGNVAAHPDSAVVLGDYKTIAGAEAEHPTRVVLIDTLTASQTIVELGSAYWFRSLARGPEGEALILTGDGSLRIVDPVTAQQVAAVPAISAWTEPAEWQQPGPVLKVVDGFAYLTDPATDELVVIDLEQQSVVERWSIPAGTVELAVVTGSAGEH